MRSHRATLFAKYTALVALFAWFVASNHCALSALVERLADDAAPAMECKNCPPKGGDSKPSGDMAACCKGIKATPSSPVLADFAAGLVGKLLGVIETLRPLAAPPSVRVAIAGTGPPRCVSFAEAVLSRCFQSHAPPVFG
jgi:hypothetical protein